MAQAWDIVGYTYRGVNRCPPCTAYRACQGATIFKPLTTSEAIAWLEREATARDIDFGDETTFDSDTFPKVIFRSTAVKEICGTCGEPLDI